MRKAMLLLASILLVPPAFADGVVMKEEKPGMLKRAKINADAATFTAQSRIPKGKIVSAEIEEEDRKLIFSFDLRTPGKTGIDEVNIDAMTGRIPWTLVNSIAMVVMPTLRAGREPMTIAGAAAERSGLFSSCTCPSARALTISSPLLARRRCGSPGRTSRSRRGGSRGLSRCRSRRL